MSNLTISDQEFAQLRRILYQQAGISLADSKKQMVIGRLNKRLLHSGHNGFTSYLRKVASGDDAELRIMIDLLTTNETYFFREPKHFDFLRHFALTRVNPKAPFTVWSAASSSGEEAYSAAMVLMEALGATVQWDIMGSDISTRIIERAQTGHYAMERANNIPEQYLRKYCLKGVRDQEGTFLISPDVRARVRFRYLNLIERLPDNIGPFDFIFLRNVMIYFDVETKRKVVNTLTRKLRHGGFLLVGHSESLTGIDDNLIGVRPAIYQKP
jgi:chemotaxis protein methyltransferase CheR